MPSPKATATHLSFAIKKVKDFSFFVNERLVDLHTPRPIRIELGHTLEADIQKSLVDFTFEIYLYYQDAKPEEVLAGIKVQNLFEIYNLKQFIEGETALLPNELIISIISISISHGRALFAKNLAGTGLQDVILPISNPAEVAQQFFPEMFKSPPKNLEPKKAKKATDKPR